MKKGSAALLTAAFILFIAGPRSAFGETGSGDDGDSLLRPYVGISVAAFNMDIGGGFGTSTAPGASLRLGMDIGDYLGIEGRLGQTADADFSGTFVTGGIPVHVGGTASVTLFSAFARLRLPVLEPFAIYALAGGTHGSASTTLSVGLPGFFPLTFSAIGDSNSFSFGAGIEYHHASGFVLGGEYVRYFSDLGAFGLNLGYRF